MERHEQIMWRTMRWSRDIGQIREDMRLERDMDRSREDMSYGET